MRLFVPRHLLRERGVVIGWHVQSDAPDSDVFICISTIPSESAHRFVPSDVAAAGVRDVADAWPRELTNAVFDRASSLLFRDITSAAVDRDDLVWSDVRVLGAWRVDGVERIANAVFTVSDDDETDDELGLLRVERVDGRRTPVQVVYVDVLSRSEYFVDCTSANVVSSDVWLQATSAPSVSASALSSVLSRMSRVDALGAAIDSVYVPKRHAARQSGILGRLGAVVQSVVVALVTLAMMPIAALLWLQSAVGRFGAVARLARISQFATSLRERAELADRWRVRAPLLREAASDAAARRRQTMRVLQLRDDTVRVCVDVLLGFVAMLALLLVARDVTPSLSATEAWLTHDVVRKLIVWMMGWPAGFKLNGPLSGFIGALFLLFVDSWTTVVVWCGLRDIPPPLVVVALIGPLGLSVQLALVVDLLNVFTIHVRCFYLVAARLHAAQWATLRSFWYLFRGRKHNVLRERIDTLHHDLEQLLLGTVLFTTLVFLAPTVAFYYVCFAALALALAAIRATLHAVRHAVLTLPFYGLLARAVHPAALPDSIVFELLGVAGAKVQAATTHLALRSVPLAAGALFGDVKAVIAATSAQVQLSSIVGRFVRGAARKETANAIEIAGGVRVQS